MSVDLLLFSLLFYGIEFGLKRIDISLQILLPPQLRYSTGCFGKQWYQHCVIAHSIMKWNIAELPRLPVKLATRCDRAVDPS